MAGEREARRSLVSNLRTAADVLADRGDALTREGEEEVAIDLRQAANEIEDLGRWNQQFRRAFRWHLSHALTEALLSIHSRDSHDMEPRLIHNWEEAEPDKFTIKMADREVEIYLSVHVTHKLAD